jgi:hypothetical protein
MFSPLFIALFQDSRETWSIGREILTASSTIEDERDKCDAINLESFRAFQQQGTFLSRIDSTILAFWPWYSDLLDFGIRYLAINSYIVRSE